MKSVLILLLGVFSLQVHAIQLEEAVRTYELPNGLRVLCLQRPQSPTFAAFTLFPSGRVDEPAGKAGIAHLLEHMMFKGTETLGTKDYELEAPLLSRLDSLGTRLINERAKSEPDSTTIAELDSLFQETESLAAQYVAKGELGNLYMKHGARRLNAGTGMDFTIYVVSLPSNRLRLWARVMSDVLENTVFREFYKEKDVVLNEIRMGDDEPEDVFWDTFRRTAFHIHPYGQPIAGREEEVERLTVEDVTDYYRKHYVLSNAIVALVGDLKWNEVVSVIDEYFSHFPAAEPPDRRVPQEPEQTEERTLTIELDAEPRLGIGYRVPTYPNRDSYVIGVISRILSGGRTSRLHKRLVETGLAASAYTQTGYPGVRYPTLFLFEAEPITPHTPEEVALVFQEEIEKLKNEPVSQFELERSKNQVRAGFVRGLQSNGSIAFRLLYFEALYGGWQNIPAYPDIIAGVTRDDIMRVARTYFTNAKRITLISRKVPSNVKSGGRS